MPVVPIRASKSASDSVSKSTCCVSQAFDEVAVAGRSGLKASATRRSRRFWNQNQASLDGPAQIRGQLKRFKGWGISIKAINRVLKRHGFESVYRGRRPQGETVKRFEAPRRNACGKPIRRGASGAGETIRADYVDDFLVTWSDAHCVRRHRATLRIKTSRAAVARHQRMRIGAYRRGQRVLESRSKVTSRDLEGEKHSLIVGKSYRREGGGKVENTVRRVQYRELWDLEHFEEMVATPSERLEEFFDDCDERRAGMESMA